MAINKYAAPQRDVMNAGVKTTHKDSSDAAVVLRNTHAVLCAFIGKLSGAIHEVFSGEDSDLKNALELILQMDASYGFYPLLKLIRGGSPSASHFKRIGDDPDHSMITKLSKDPEKARKSSGKRLRLKVLQSTIENHDSGEEPYKARKNQPSLQSLREEAEKLSEQIASYDKLMESNESQFPEFENWFKPKSSDGFQLSSAFGELILTDALQYVSHHFELLADFEEKEKVRKSKLEAFKKTEDGKFLLAACEGLEKGPMTFIESYQFPTFANWRGKCPDPELPELDISHRSWGRKFRELNPELESFFDAKFTFRELSKQDKPPTWRSVCWKEGRFKDLRKGRRYPFLSLKHFCGNKGFDVELMEDGRACAHLMVQLLDVSEECLEFALQGEPHPGFSIQKKKEMTEIVLVPDARLEKALRANGTQDQKIFHVTDQKSGRIFTREFTGLRFHEDKGRWEARLTFKPNLGEPEDFSDVMKEYQAGKPAPFKPGTLISTFVVTATGTYLPDKPGWFTTFGVEEDGSLKQLYTTAVTPHLEEGSTNLYLETGGRNTILFKSGKGKELSERQIRRRAKKRNRRKSWTDGNKDKNNLVMSSRRSKKRGVGRGRTRLVQLIDLVEIKRTIATRLRQSGRPKNRPAKGDNYHLWQKFNECAESFREQFSAQVLRLALQVEGRRQVQGNLSEVEVSQPRKVTEWKTRYPDAGHLLVVPAPMGASHQPFRDKQDNRVLHTFGVAGLYSKILTKCWYSGLSATFITKVGMWNRNPFTGETFTSPNTGQLELSDGQGNLKSISRGLLGTTNLAWRLMNPLPKKKEKDKA